VLSTRCGGRHLSAIIDNHTVPDAYTAWAPGRERVVVGDQDESHVGFFVEIEQEVGDIRYVVAVEIPRRLIGEQEFRFIDNGARWPDRDWIMQSLVVDRSFRHALRRMDGRRFPHPAREDSRGPA
jgi:hypothetical protein